jgi:hypothetical protein
MINNMLFYIHLCMASQLMSHHHALNMATMLFRATTPVRAMRCFAPSFLSALQNTHHASCACHQLSYAPTLQH